MRFISSKALLLCCCMMPGVGQALEVYNYFGLSTGYAVKHQPSPDNDLMDSGEKAYVGIRFLGPVGLEISYYDLGKYDTETTAVTVVGAHAVFNQDIRGMTLFFKAGAIEWREKDLTTGGTLTGEDVSYGIGINLAVDRHVLFRTELERFRKVGRDTAAADPGTEMSLFSFGVNFQF